MDKKKLSAILIAALLGLTVVAITQYTRAENWKDLVHTRDAMVSELADATYELRSERDIQRMEFAERLGLLEATIDSLNAETQTLLGEMESLRSQKRELDNQMLSSSRKLQQTTEERDRLLELHETRRSLEADIEELREERQALLPRTVLTDIKCTGSMEPVITCLDEIELLTNPLIEEVVTGSIISFSPANCEEGSDGGHILHRVIDIENSNDVRYYKTQGDNTLFPDNCETTFSDIYGLLTGLERAVYPANQELRSLVNSAIEEYYELVEFCEQGCHQQLLTEQSKALCRLESLLDYAEFHRYEMPVLHFIPTCLLLPDRG